MRPPKMMFVSGKESDPAKIQHVSLFPLVDYSLTFHATNYVLTANGANILAGPVRDYTAFSGFPNPYSSTNFLFFGDDTSSAGGAFVLRKVVLITAPQLIALSSQWVTWTGVSNQTYTVESSSNLLQ
jgi:hypothetical protein